MTYEVQFHCYTSGPTITRCYYGHNMPLIPRVGEIVSGDMFDNTIPINRIVEAVHYTYTGTDLIQVVIEVDID